MRDSSFAGITSRYRDIVYYLAIGDSDLDHESPILSAIGGKTREDVEGEEREKKMGEKDEWREEAEVLAGTMDADGRRN